MDLQFAALNTVGQNPAIGKTGPNITSNKASKVRKASAVEPAVTCGETVMVGCLTTVISTSKLHRVCTPVCAIQL